MAVNENGLHPLHYYGPEWTTPSWIEMRSDGSLWRDPSKSGDAQIRDWDGKPCLYDSKYHVSGYDLARLILSTLIGPPPPGRECVGYKDGNVANVSINNLFWYGDGAPVRGNDCLNDFERGVKDGAEIVEKSEQVDYKVSYLRGVNQEISRHL